MDCQLMFRDYLRLIRAPNLFTVPSNILAGYFAVIPTGVVDTGQLLSLLFSSIFLYVFGIILNDYVDIEVDRNERPDRPLVSGRITKRNALTVAVMSIIVGNFLALTVSWASIAISALLTFVIIAYNLRLKRGSVTNPLSMGSARFLNVVLGGSPVVALFSIPHQSYTLLIFIGYCLFLHTAAVSILSRIEMDIVKIYSRSNWITIFISFSVVLVVIVSILVIGLEGAFQSWFVVNLILYSVVMIFTILHLMMRLRNLTKIGKIKRNEDHYTSPDEESTRKGARLEATREIQSTIKIMILSIIILDSIFLSGIAGITVGMGTLLLLIPPILLGRRLYLT
jgi:4-hydroxybenzoate polyprenyltransferase